MSVDPASFTTLLQAAQAGDSGAEGRLYAQVYAELKRIARSQIRRVGGALTVHPSTLVHEAYLKFVGGAGRELVSSQHFFNLLAQAMRQILIDHARARLADRRGGGAAKVSLQALEGGRFAVEDSAFEIVRIHEALERLAQLDERLVRVAELRLFAGLEISEVAQALGVSEPTVKRDARAVLAFLQAELDQSA